MTDADVVTTAAGAISHVAEQLRLAEEHAHALEVERDGLLCQLAESMERERALMVGLLRDAADDRDWLQVEIERLTVLNEDKFRTIQAYCKAADEDRARIRRLVELLQQWWDFHCTGPYSDLFDRTLTAITEAEEWDRGRS
jgi:hypothetical protein